ncbi:hypothetical protein JZO77_12470 [Enterococcus hulanensis]|uniref:hypothetical protein n=1 Tax=Enterococcus hulanensis TaxID=2559929 RepID=UPI001A8E1BB0|nr:hypothetical protein [Enterococcus hulanensis]MBO0457545.1 hypothetical protein [Enterococcus hulanensis]
MKLMKCWWVSSEKLESLSIDLTLDTKEHTKQGKITAKSTNDGASYTVKMTMNQWREFLKI